MKQERVEEIQRLVRQQIELYQTLLKIQQEKLEVLLSSDAARSEELSGRERQFFPKLKAGQKALDAALEGQTLTGVLAETPPDERRELAPLVDDLRNLLRESADCNHRNARYVQASFSFGQSMLQEVFRHQSSYDVSGHVHANGEGMRRKGMIF